MANKTDLKVGQRVRCFRTHDKFTPLEGTIVAVFDDGMVTVNVAASGSASLITASAADCTVLAGAAVASSPAGTAGAAKVSNPIT